MVCVSVGRVHEPCKMAEPIEMSFRWVTLLGPKNQLLVGGPDRGAIIGAVWSINKHRETLLRCTQQKNLYKCMSGTFAADCIFADWPVSH